MVRRVPICLLLFVASTGRAATRAFAETYETRTGSAGDAQMETWLDDADALGNWGVWRWWAGGTASLTDSIEVSAYVLAAQQWTEGEATDSLQLEMLYLLTRWRFLGDGAKGFSLMGQLEFCLPMMPTVQDRQATPILAHGTAVGERVIASYDTSHFLVSANLLLEEATQLAPGTTSTGYSDPRLALKWAAGAAYAPWPSGLHGPPFTIGAEAFGDIGFPYPGSNPQVPIRSGVWSVWWPGAFPVAFGPALSMAVGRFWATASWGWAPGGAASLTTTDGATYRIQDYGAHETVGRLIVAFEF